MTRLWFFDLDGTLADLGLACPGFDRDFVAGPPIEDMARTLLPDVYTDALGAEIRARFGAHYDHDGFVHTAEYPGVVDRVRALKAAGATVVVATNKRYAGARLMAEKFGWDAVFDGIYSGDRFRDDPAIGKMTKTQLLAFLMRRYGAEPGACAIVGDTKSDFLAARANGIASVGVAWGYGTPEELALADRVVKSPSEI